MSLQIIAIDSRIATSQLLAALPAASHVLIINSQRDGLEQLVAALAGLHDIDSLHLLTHADSGSLLLGSSNLDRDALSAHSELLRTLGSQLSTSADLLLYGCNLAAGSAGQAFIAQLASLTGADVAASSDLSGVGGDWVLEASTGQIETTGLELGTLAGTLQSFYGGTAADTLTGTPEDDYLEGNGGNDRLSGAAGSDSLWGGAGNDSLLGGDDNDELVGEAGADLLDGGEGDDILYGGSEADTLRGGNANDSLYGEAGNDSLQGNDGNDYLEDLEGSNLLEGGSGSDTLSGGDGNDTLDGGSGADVLNGGTGNTTFYVDDLRDVITDAGGNDTLIIGIDNYLATNTDIENIVYAEGVKALPYFISTLASGTFWGTQGAASTITYSFVAHPAEEDAVSGFAAYTSTQKAAVRTVLAQYSAVAGLTFVEEADDSDSALRFFRDDLAASDSSAAGYAIHAGDVHINSTGYSDLSTKGGIGFLTLLQQTGYALGLKLTAETPSLRTDEDSMANTVMTANLGGTLTSTLGMFDLATLHYLYGVNSEARSGDNAYTLGSHYIWDGAGNDSITASTQTSSVSIDLTPGSWSYIGTRNDSILASGQSFLGFGSWIENAIGGSAADRLTGNALANLLDGRAGADTMTGGAGNDTYMVDNSGDVLVEGSGGGIDQVNSSVSHILAANLERLTLLGTAAINGIGNALDNSLTGNAAANILNGSRGADTMSGGGGNDTYFVDNSGDLVIELSGAGNDQVYSSISLILGNNLERLSLTGSSAINASGNTLANTLTGNTAANLLNGGTGADTMIGGDGNDSYVVENAGDVIREYSDEGTDLVYSSISYTLGSYLEKLTLTESYTINATGNSLANTLTGNGAANILNGGSGADTLIGGAGNDSYVVDNSGDVIVETSTGGSDLVSSSVSYTLSSYVEQLSLTGSSAINATGNAQANTLIGNIAANILQGAAGNDILIGKLGRDTLTGGIGNDRFVLETLGDSGLTSTTRDVITDFVRGSDKLDLSALDANSALAGNQAFTSFIGASRAFTAAGQLRLSNGVLYANTDDDSAAELSITLTGVTTLSLSDLLL